MLFDYTFADYTLPFPGFELRIRAATNFEACVDRMFEHDAFSEEHAPYGAALWPAAIALGQALCARPTLCRDKRVLELGCGVGLGALVAAKLGARVTASDFHPDVGELLARNAAENGATIAYQRIDWADLSVKGDYDTVIASDVLYDPRLTPLCLGAIERLLGPSGTALLSDPQRGQLTRLRQGLAERDFRWSEDVQVVDFAGQKANCIVFCLQRRHPASS